MSSSNVSYPPAPQSPTTISDLEQIIASALEALRNAPLSESITAAYPYFHPQGLRLRVQLEEDGRKKRSTAAASNWNPETGEIVIFFERADATNVQSVLSKPITPIPPTLKAVTAPQSLGPMTPPPSPPRPYQGTGRPPALPSSYSPSAIDSGSQSATPDSGEVTPLQIQQCCEALAEAEKAGKSFIALKWFRDNDLTSRGYKWADSVANRQAVLTKAIEIGAVLTTPIPNPKAPQHPTTTVKLNRESKYSQAVAPRFQPIRTRGGESASEILLRDRGRF